MYKIIQKFVTKNRTYKVLKPVGVALHETANAGSPALNHYTYFNSGDRSALAHIFVDWNDENDIIQLAPLNECTWHAKEPANSMFISVEMCRPKTHNVEQFNKVWDKCVWLFADIFINTLKITTVTKDNLMSHDEIRLKWKKTSHTDPTVLLKEYGKTMDDFRNAIQMEINEMTKPVLPKDELREALEFIDKNICDVDADLWYANCKSGKIQFLDALMVKIGNGLKSKIK
jgi:N-acetylmuramoyl-L-alanine amidase CwlA